MIFECLGLVIYLHTRKSIWNPKSRMPQPNSSVNWRSKTFLISGAPGSPFSPPGRTCTETLWHDPGTGVADLTRLAAPSMWGAAGGCGVLPTPAWPACTEVHHAPGIAIATSQGGRTLPGLRFNCCSAKLFGGGKLGDRRHVAKYNR